MESAEGRRLHQQAAEAREHGDLPAALGLVFQAEEAYRKDGDKLGQSEIYADASITLRNTGEQEDDRSLLIAAKHFAEISVEIANDANNKAALGLAYYNLGKCQEALMELSAAVDSYADALEIMQTNPPERHDRAAVLADIRLHLEIATYRADENNDKQLALDALEELKNAEGATDDERKKWVSGAHMDIARMLKDDSPDEARQHLDEAKKIIASDESLIVRKRQWEKLAKEFK